jgi:hypothetical protein
MADLHFRLAHALVDDREMFQTESNPYFVIQKFKLLLRLCKMMNSFIIWGARRMQIDCKTNFLWRIFGC